MRSRRRRPWSSAFRACRPDDQTIRWILRIALQMNTGSRPPGAHRGVDLDTLEELGVELPAKTRDKLSAKELRARCAQRLEQVEKKPVQPSMATENAHLLASVLGLSPAEQAVLAFVIGLDSDGALRDAWNRLQTRSLQRTVEQLAQVLSVPVGKVRKAMRGDGPLRSLPLVELPRADGPMERDLTLSQTIGNALLRPLADERDLVKHFIAASTPATLTLADYPHVSDDVKLLARFLKAALARKTKGVNVLIHGPSGSGKTQLVSALAAELGAALDVVCFEDEDNDVLPGQQRLERYALCQRVLRSRRNALLLFDEAEDAFPRGFASLFGQESGRNKAWTNQLLENNGVPTLWVSNAISQIDRAFIRRFDFVLELQHPPRSVRRKILQKHLQGAPVSDAQLDELSEREELSPGHTERAARFVKLLRPGSPARLRDDLDRVIDANLRAITGKRTAQRPRSVLRYDRTLLNVNVDPDKLMAGLQRTRSGTACFYGPPGSGKTELARHIAETLDMQLLTYRASDLLGPYVGQTEQQIAAMFTRAKRDGAVLLLDEADSFLRDRRGAHRSWEVTQVNEMLTQMESFDGIFLCSTNLLEQLDKASLRRFAFKVKFDYLRPEQTARLFLELLGSDGTENVDALARVTELRFVTPGDFAAVARRWHVLGERPSAEELAQALAEECALKGERGGRSVGFGAG
jgi:transitional endoplasmic reticulum ATPase